MAIRIRCSECSKKISIDEAFAGGACRCPYCKAIMMVPGDGKEASSARPSAPRPDSPDAVVAGAARPAVAPTEVPMADRVRIQSYAAVVVIGLLLLATVAGVIVLALSLGSKEKKNDQKKNEPPKTLVDVANPFETKVEGASIASDVKITTPIVYVIDCGASMQRMIDLSSKIVRVSVRTLGPQGKFTVIMALSEETPGHPPTGTVKLPSGSVMLENGFVNGGKPGEKTAAKFMSDLEEVEYCGHGVVDVVPSIKSALAMNPKTVVVFTNKEINGAEELIASAQKAGIKLVTMGMETDDLVRESLQKLSDGAKSETRAYTLPQLMSWVEKFKDED
jgi:phage FluMu protein Com